ncbi:TPA: PHP domain-containing protein [Candidatus Poribacteria bacterium]|nr:PHP domain-containing protein [Candidatus Poribacteria bacterium]
MGKDRVDLHVHTTASDGTYSPAEVIELAKKAGLAAIAITDHDTLSGAIEGVKLSREMKFEVIGGVELSSDLNGTDVHILGYLITRYRIIQKVLDELQNLRSTRAERMVRKLNRLGINISIEDVLREARGDSIGRPHIAAAMVRRGIVPSTRYAFRYYIGDNGPAYIPKPKLTPIQAVELILASGGVPVMAHPGLTENDHIIEELVKHGLRGLEVFYPMHDEGQIERYLEMAEREGLIVTGGSDFHGATKPDIQIGSVTVGYESIERLRKEAEKIWNSTSNYDTISAIWSVLEEG